MIFRCASIDIGVVNLAFCVIEFIETRDGTFAFNLIHMERARIGSMRETMDAVGKKLLPFTAQVTRCRIKSSTMFSSSNSSPVR